MNLKSLLVAFILLAGVLPAHAEKQPSCKTALQSSTSLGAEAWLQSEQSLAVKHIIRNISPIDLVKKDGKPVPALPGTVVAARTDYYFYHWVRDAGLVMTTVADHSRKTKVTADQKTLERKLEEYLSLTKHLQAVEAQTELEKKTYTGLGEPKYHLNGTIFTDPWGRPQNDGPALRAISFISWANALIAEGKVDFVRKHLYDSRYKSGSTIKNDLEFISHHWRQPSFDLWEEVKGDHFYTRMVHRKAMIEGAKLARSLGDPYAADWYSKQAIEIEKSILNFWDHSKGHFVATQNRVEGLDYKHSDLDIAVVLGLLHGQTDDNFLNFSDVRVLMTIEKLIYAFQQEYPINQRAGIPGVAIGRYPEDQYAGSYSGYKQGNPWVLTTLAVAEAYYKAAKELKQQNRWTEAEALIVKGDDFVARVKYHAYPNGSLSEQFHRDTGYMTSVEDLTWNYAAVLTAYWARTEAVK